MKPFFGIILKLHYFPSMRCQNHVREIRWAQTKAFSKAISGHQESHPELIPGMFMASAIDIATNNTVHYEEKYIVNDKQSFSVII